MTYETSGLIPYQDRLIGTETLPTVDGRDLHVFLEIARDYADWVKRQIKRAGLVEHRDYEVFYNHVENSGRGRPSVDYHFSFDAAKHIGMLSNTDKGKQVREYFLQCEKALQTQTTALPHLHDPKLQMMVEAIVRMDALEQELTAQRQLAQSTQNMALEILRAQTWMTIRQYVYVHELARQMPLSQQRAYATWLGGYCLEKGIPMYKALTADTAWPDERTYHIGAIHETLHPWIGRRYKQVPLTIIPPTYDHNEP